MLEQPIAKDENKGKGSDHSSDMTESDLESDDDEEVTKKKEAQ